MYMLSSQRVIARQQQLSILPGSWLVRQQIACSHTVLLSVAYHEWSDENSSYIVQVIESILVCVVIIVT